MTSDENFNAMLDMISQAPTVKVASLILDLGGALTLDSEAHGVFSLQRSLTRPWVVKAVLAELLGAGPKSERYFLQIKSRRYAEGADVACIALGPK